MITGAVVGVLLGLVPEKLVRRAVALAVLVCVALYAGWFWSDPDSSGHLLELFASMAFAVPFFLLPGAIVAFGTCHYSTRIEPGVAAVSWTEGLTRKQAQGPRGRVA